MNQCDQRYCLKQTLLATKPQLPPTPASKLRMGPELWKKTPAPTPKLHPIIEKTPISRTVLLSRLSIFLCLSMRDNSPLSVIVFEQIIMKIYSPFVCLLISLFSQKRLIKQPPSSDYLLVVNDFIKYQSESQMESDNAYSNKADQFMKQAQKSLKGSFFGNIMSNKSERAEEAIELFKQAATNYKLAKRWDDAARAYIQCVECDKLCKGGQAADFYQQAANVKQKVNTAECIKFLQTSIQLYINTNRMSNVAKTQKRIAEIYEKDGEYTLAIKYYKDAADNYSLEQNQASSYNTCMLKVVDIGVFAAAPDYGELIKILENVADKYMQNKLTAPSAKELYFKAVLLFLANGDEVGADQALKRYLNNDPTFFQTRQQKFVQSIISSVKEQNLGLFSNECFKFNEIIPFDKWKTTVLTKVKAFIPEEGGAPAKKTTEEEDVEL